MNSYLDIYSWLSVCPRDPDPKMSDNDIPSTVVSPQGDNSIVVADDKLECFLRIASTNLCEWLTFPMLALHGVKNGNKGKKRR